ncbi:MAG: 3-hydroxy-fatty acyl-ACP dehydratase [Opitutaceae bacterium]|jgi:predicted hotdog family 3-hydroxylacyl-ACP dehydratase|nr:3-hydroxy-fatty acyl-ACP dehydratase [Opitutaceae bacterium]
MHLDLPAADYLPHEPPMLLVQRLLEITPDTVACHTAPDAATFAPFANQDGSLPAALLLEIMAQTIGVWAGWHCRAAGQPVQPGLILGCRDFSATLATLPAGACLRSTARKIFYDDGTATFECAVETDTVRIASATLTTRRVTWDQLENLLPPSRPGLSPQAKPVTRLP